MSSLAAAAALVVVIGLIGVVVQLPEILSHHINQPAQRARRVRALRKKLAIGVAAFLLAAAIAYWLVNA